MESKGISEDLCWSCKLSYDNFEKQYVILPCFHNICKKCYLGKDSKTTQILCPEC